LEAAQAICLDQGEQASIDDIGEQVETLVNQSLVLAVPVEDEESGEDRSRRFRLLEPVRDYALGHLQLSREREEVYRRLAHYYLSVTEQREPALERLALQGLMLEQGNIRAGLEWALARGEAELVQRFSGVLEMYWEASGQFQEGQRWIEAALAMEGATPKQVQAKLLLAASRLAVWAMAYQRAVALAQQALTLYDACEDARGEGRARYQLGEAWYEQGEYARAIEAFEASLNVQRAGEDWPGYARTLTMLGAISLLQGNLPRAEVQLNEALAVLQKTGDPASVSSSLLGHLGIVALLQENIPQALRFFKEALLRSHELGHRFRLAMELITMGCALGMAGELCYAAQVCSAAEALLERLGTGVPLVYRPLMTTLLQRIQAQADKSTWQGWWTQGRSLPLDQAVALALDGCQQVLAS
jgi:tetratricopeptide (TPR) repeat protein